MDGAGMTGRRTRALRQRGASSRRKGTPMRREIDVEADGASGGGEFRGAPYGRAVMARSLDKLRQRARSRTLTAEERASALLLESELGIDPGASVLLEDERI